MIKLFISCFVFVLSISSHVQAIPIYADTVNSFTGGADFAVVDGSGGNYTGASGYGVFDALAVSELDGAVLALGYDTSSIGEIVMSFSTGSIIDGAGADLRFYDSFGLSEGFMLDISLDGLTFFSVGTFTGDLITTCSPGLPCITDVDISGAGISSASFFRITADPLSSVLFHPAGYDLDAVEALNFSAAFIPPVQSIPEPGSIALFGLGLAGIWFSIKRGKLS
uniref:PEP-CTERM sorting domain-containing protein n=1 Tax=Marinobacterium profundum TaxID=1714300 RepID=UPI0009E83AAB|nr:PEP-CTERM sorting domain-containing protein [Marinobacterium profundum]